MATDPPFNKGRDFHATPESLSDGASFIDRWDWDRDVGGHQDWIDAIQDDWPALWAVIDWTRMVHSDAMGAFLCNLAVRVLELHRILKPGGTLTMHCDHTANAYVRTMLDAVFGRKGFRNEIVWCYNGGGVPKADFPRKHDTIFRYVKAGGQPTFNVERVPYGAHNADGQQRRATSHGGTRSRDYHPDGTPRVDWWTDPKPLINWDDEKLLGYATQKPVALYERIVRACSNEGDVVLDPYCGCATTIVAAEQLGRRWIGIDYWSAPPKCSASGSNAASGPRRRPCEATTATPPRRRCVPSGRPTRRRGARCSPAPRCSPSCLSSRAGAAVDATAPTTIRSSGRLTTSRPAPTAG